MSVLTIGSVDNTTDQITITAHGLVTGDGPVAIFTVAGTYPSPLAAVTDYWVIRVDANTIKLATSSANALLGTAINLTTNGSGTLLLLLGIPYRRARTYVAGSQVKSADLDALQDSWVALWNFLTGQAQSVYSGIVLATGKTLTLVDGLPALKYGQDELYLAAGAFQNSSSGGSTLGDGQITFSAIAIVSAAVPLGPSRRVKNVVLEYNRGGAGTVTMTLKKRVAGTLTTISTQAFASGTGWTTGSFGTPPNYTIASGEKLYVNVQCDNAANIVGGVAIQFDQP